GRGEEGEGGKRKGRFSDPKDPAATEAFQQYEAATAAHIKSLGFTWAKHVYAANMEKPFAEHNLEWTIEAALEFIEANKDKPFYLHFCTTLLHGPDGSWEQSMKHPRITGEGLVEREYDAEMPARASVRERVEKAGKSGQPLGYTWLDDGVGAVMKKLEELGLTEKTVFVYLPDHGSQFKASLFNKDGRRCP
ncbi:MAG: sulfatase-like hydrolase/transferase, partial [Bdellovibrionaceae bacterium]|nr:sulfatase-like hydrolase/transferase [Pseudobdellovibrionaceae bacterium]